jgi:hypothetical protein
MVVISRLYDHYSAAARAVAELERAGVLHDDISIVTNNSEGWYDDTQIRRIDRDRDGVDDRTEGAAKAAGIGAAVGGMAGGLAALGYWRSPGSVQSLPPDGWLRPRPSQWPAAQPAVSSAH